MKYEAMHLRTIDFRNRIFQLLFQARCELLEYDAIFSTVESYISDLRNLK